MAQAYLGRNQIRAFSVPYSPKKGSWIMTDMSQYLVHITRDYDSMMSILSAQYLAPSGPFGLLNRRSPRPLEVVCFSEKPLRTLGQLIHRRSSQLDDYYGIVFTKTFIESRGGSRVWYIEEGSSQASALMALADENSATADSPFWHLAPMIELVTNGRTQRRDFDWEREWRVPRVLAFESQNVSFLIIPEHKHERAREFFNEAEAEHLGPNYTCQFIDPLRLQATAAPIAE